MKIAVTLSRLLNDLAVCVLRQDYPVGCRG
ncbi:UNVERIFIED_ORG: hypothetical protein ABIB52_004726, partial [Arthrobacter sp. UYCu721]